MRSKLFVPGTRTEFYDRAINSDADAISFDLEDSVLDKDKVKARQLLFSYLNGLKKETNKTIIIRINDMSTPFFLDDLTMCCSLPSVNLINIPKIESKHQMRSFFAFYDGICKQISSDIREQKVLVNIETALALTNATEIANTDHRIAGLQLGLGDLYEPLSIERYNRANVHLTMMLLRIAAGSANVFAYDTAFANIKDSIGYKEEAMLAKSLGFIGKTCIHPSQITIANQVFSPSEEEIAWAKRVIESKNEHNHGAYMLDGKMIDIPFIKKAEMILALKN